MRTIQLLLMSGVATACGAARAQEQVIEDGPIIVGENKPKWTRFDLQRFQAALELQTRYRSDHRSQDGEPDITDREAVLRELVEFSGEAFIGHKNLIDLTGSVKFGLEDRFLDFETVQNTDHSQDFTTLFDLNAHVLGNSKVPFDVFARREEQLLDRDFAASVTNTITEYGAAASIQSITAPTNIRIARHESVFDDPTGDFDYSQDQDTFALQSIINVAKNNRLDVQYTFDDITDRRGIAYDNAYQRHNLQLTDVYTFGKANHHELRSYLRYFEESGLLSQRTLRWDEQLTLIHSRRLETRYKLSADRRTVNDSDQDQLDTSATIKHRLFESLTSTGTVGTRRFSDSSDSTSSEWYADGTLDYTKKVPRGRLDLTLGGSFNAQDNSERGTTIRVFDDAQVFDDPLPITLARRHIVPGSLEVSAVSGFPVYLEGVHYTARYFQDRVEVRIIIGSGISDGDVLLFDYDVGPEPASTVNTTGLAASIRYTLTEGWLNGLSGYALYRRTDYSVSSADPGLLVFDDTVTMTYGVEYRRDDWHVKGEREHHESSITPYDTTRLEASYIGLAEGSSSNLLETSKEIIAVTEFKNANAEPLAEAPAPHGAASLTLASLNIRITEFWENCREEQYVADDGPQPFRAVEIAVSQGAMAGQWVGEETKAGGPANMDGVTVRVLADGAAWSPPTAPSGTDYFFTFEGKQYPLHSAGDEAFPGWKIESLQRFTKATVTDGVLADTGTQENPAVEVIVTNASGTRERHRCFRSFPDMVMTSTLEGSARSNATLGATAATRQQEVLVIYGPVSSPRVGYVDFRGDGRELVAVNGRTYEAGTRRFFILNQYSNARSATRFVKAALAPERRPALVMNIAGQPEPVIVPWKGFAPVTDGSGHSLLLSYGPKFVALPFTIQLKDFRKMDYPGTDMAMAYESDVIISTPGESDTPYLVHMNTPYAAYPWKVYQSGFRGEATSIFSVMRDPGLKLTYLGSTVLCVGIFLTFFARSFSWGHPGIPAPHLHENPTNNIHKESTHAPLTPVHPAGPAALPEPVLTGARG